MEENARLSFYAAEELVGCHFNSNKLLLLLSFQISQNDSSIRTPDTISRVPHELSEFWLAAVVKD